MRLVHYPLYLVEFWYKDALIKVAVLCFDIIVYLLELFSVPLMVRTFFKPLKNEYRGDLVLFSRVVGVLVKSFLIFIALAVLAVVIFLEIVFLGLFLVFPLLPIYLYFV